MTIKAEDAALKINQTNIVSAFCRIIETLGDDPRREGLVDTPQRVARMYAEVFSGIGEDPLAILTTGFEEGHDEMVVARDIPFFSMCEHHFLPFYGVAHIGYIPRGRIVGISKLARVADVLARRPQLQERLTTQIADAVDQGVQPMGVGVVLEAEHLCMVMRGVKKPGSRIVTSVNRGVFRSDPRTRAEFLGFARDHSR
ncbi:MAG: GTP cyclohydrolase I FolE [Chloroflexota bacterium]